MQIPPPVFRSFYGFDLIPTIFHWSEICRRHKSVQATDSVCLVSWHKVSICWSGPCFQAVYARFWPLHLHISENELCLTLHALHLCRLVSVAASDLWWQQCSPAGLLMLFTICWCVRCPLLPADEPSPASELWTVCVTVAANNQMP